MFWKSSSAKIATVSEDGLVTGLRSGNARISATTSDGTKKTITFTVKVAELIKEISISGSVMIAAEQKQNLQADILPESASNRKLEWTSSDDSIVRVNKNNGQITARKTDSIKQVTISAKALDGSDISSDFVLSIHPLATNVIISQDGFILEKKAKLNISLAETQMIQLDAAVEPSEAIQSILWKSSEERVAKIDENGVVTILKKGKTTIYATADDGSRKRNTLELTISD